MPEPSTPIEMLAGVEGLALLRGLHERDDGAARRLDELRTLLRDGDGDGDGGRDRPGAAAPTEADVRTGYATWSRDYDGPGNPIVALEQPIVWSMIDELAPGRALDAACGTGRHTRHLVERGWRVTGVDLTPEMLEIARASLPQATFREARLPELAIDDASVDLVVCALAIGHLPDPTATIAAFARVLAPGGEALISVLHPLQVQLGWHAMFTGADGARGFIREHPHSHATYLRAFRDAGLEVVDCVEPTLGPDEVRARRRMFAAIPEACERAFAGLPGVLVWRVRRAG